MHLDRIRHCVSSYRCLCIIIHKNTDSRLVWKTLLKRCLRHNCTHYPGQYDFTSYPRWNPCITGNPLSSHWRLWWKHRLFQMQRNCCLKWSHQHIFKSTVIPFIDHNSKNTSSALPLDGCYSTGNCLNSLNSKHQACKKVSPNHIVCGRAYQSERERERNQTTWFRNCITGICDRI